MRISVECGGFTRAADACRTANQTAAVLTESLASRLASHAGMAGNDATSASFAASYDTGATEALAALADLTHAFIGAGRLLAATGRHHAAAEAGAAGLRTSAYVGGDLHENDYVRVQPAAPPSTLGGQEPSLGRIDTWILDQVEGFVWPGADVGGLRTAASDWRRAAATTSRLADHVDAAVALVEQQHSPEVPLAVDALTDLAGLVGDTGWQLSTVAGACEEYAAAVEEARERTRALLTEIAQMVVEGAAVSALVAGVTGGLGGSAALGAAAARVRAQAPRFHALLLALRTGTTTAAARVDRARDDLVRIRSQVERFVRVPARTERGSMRGPGGWGGGARTPGRARPEVEDTKLSNYVKDLFTGVDNPHRFGDGTTMDAIRHELRTGETVHNRRHVIKGENILRGLERWLRNHPEAPLSDREIAMQLARELREALAP